jgi:hypothetical protein
LLKFSFFRKYPLCICFSRSLCFQHIFVIFTNQMFGLYQMSVIQKLLKDVNFLSIYVFVYNNYVCDMCLHARYSRCSKTWPSSYGLCETKNKQCSSCILTTKLVTQTNYYDCMYIITVPVLHKQNVEKNNLCKWSVSIKTPRKKNRA